MSSPMETLTRSQYMQHHMANWQLNLHSLTLGNGGFWTIDLDTTLISVIMGLVFFTLFFFVARRVRVGIPSKLQTIVEMSVESIGKIVRDNCHRDVPFIAPLALTIFVWIFLMNFMDLVPVDLIPRAMGLLGASHFKAVPTTNPMLTFALSISVFVLVIYYNIKSKGIRKLGKEILKEPFGWYLFPVNIAFRLIEEFVKPISLSLRLFGNLFAGEIVFLLIATLPWWWLQIPLGFIWTAFHLLVIVIQAFIFMMLTVVYLSMAQQSH